MKSLNERSPLLLKMCLASDDFFIMAIHLVSLWVQCSDKKDPEIKAAWSCLLKKSSNKIINSVLDSHQEIFDDEVIPTDIVKKVVFSLKSFCEERIPEIVSCGKEKFLEDLETPVWAYYFHPSYRPNRRIFWANHTELYSKDTEPLFSKQLIKQIKFSKQFRRESMAQRYFEFTFVTGILFVPLTWIALFADRRLALIVLVSWLTLGVGWVAFCKSSIFLSKEYGSIVYNNLPPLKIMREQYEESLTSAHSAEMIAAQRASKKTESRQPNSSSISIQSNQSSRPISLIEHSASLLYAKSNKQSKKSKIGDPDNIKNQKHILRKGDPMLAQQSRDDLFLQEDISWFEITRYNINLFYVAIDPKILNTTAKDQEYIQRCLKYFESGQIRFSSKEKQQGLKLLTKYQGCAVFELKLFVDQYKNKRLVGSAYVNNNCVCIILNTIVNNHSAINNMQLAIPLSVERLRSRRALEAEHNNSVRRAEGEQTLSVSRMP